MSRDERSAFLKTFCGVGELKPTPENCLRSDEIHFDEVEVTAPADKIASLNAFVAQQGPPAIAVGISKVVRVLTT